MDWVTAHLLVNHFPVILGVSGTLAAAAAVFVRRGALWRYAAVTMLLAGLTAPAAFFSGREAEEIVEEFWYVDEEQIEHHEEAALVAFLALLVAGASAGVMLWRPTRGTRVVFCVLAIVATLLAVRAALEGGKIVHDSPQLQERESASTRAGTTRFGTTETGTTRIAFRGAEVRSAASGSADSRSAGFCSSPAPTRPGSSHTSRSLR